MRMKYRKYSHELSFFFFQLFICGILNYYSPCIHAVHTSDTVSKICVPQRHIALCPVRIPNSAGQFLFHTPMLRSGFNFVCFTARQYPTSAGAVILCFHLFTCICGRLPVEPALCSIGRPRIQPPPQFSSRILKPSR